MHDPVERFIEDLRLEADTSDFTHLTESTVARATRRSPWRLLKNRAATVAASFTLAFGALGGVAYGANGAVPGDTLYGFDRALENIGIGNGGASERLSEMRSLVEAGEVGRGLQHAADTIIADLDAQTALLDAAGRVVDTTAPTGVPPLLEYLAENIGDVDGSVVAELATHIGGLPEQTPVGPPEETPVGPPEETPVGPPGEGEPPNGPPNGPGPDLTPPTTTP